MTPDHTEDSNTSPSRVRSHAWVVWTLAGIGAALLVIDHWAHVFGLLPYVILLACPIMHFFMHRGHGHERHKR